MSEGIEGCPWCGELPYFEGGGDNWQDDRRYVEMHIACCAAMRTGIGYGKAKDMTTSEREKMMKEILIIKWNSRYKEESDDI